MLAVNYVCNFHEFSFAVLLAGRGLSDAMMLKFQTSRTKSVGDGYFWYFSHLIYEVVGIKLFLFFCPSLPVLFILNQNNQSLPSQRPVWHYQSMRHSLFLALAALENTENDYAECSWSILSAISAIFICRFIGWSGIICCHHVALLNLKDETLGHWVFLILFNILFMTWIASSFFCSMALHFLFLFNCNQNIHSLPYQRPLWQYQSMRHYFYTKDLHVFIMRIIWFVETS